MQFTQGMILLLLSLSLNSPFQFRQPRIICPVVFFENLHLSKYKKSSSSSGLCAIFDFRRKKMEVNT